MSPNPNIQKIPMRQYFRRLNSMATFVKMAMSLWSTLSSQIPTGPHLLTLNTLNTQCIPHFFRRLDAGSGAGKQRNPYQRWEKGDNGESKIKLSIIH